MTTQPEKDYWVYILLCENMNYYTGYTTDLLKRYQSHVNGTGRCKYTRSFKPIKIAQCWQIKGTKALAMEIERAIKKLSKQEKEALILKPENWQNDGRIRPITNQILQQMSKESA